jgi:hypothetical protein
MEIKNHVRKLTFRAISILLLVIATASLPNSKGGITRNQAVNQYQWNDPNTPISATLRIDHLPTLGEPAKVDCIVSSKLDAPGTQVQIELPSDAKLLKGNLGWEGDILTGDSITVTATIAFSSIGNKGIFCRALRSLDDNNVWGDLAELYLSIGQEGSTLGFPSIPRENRLEYGILLGEGEGQPIEATGPILMPVEPQATEDIPSLLPTSDDGKSYLSSSVNAVGDLTITGSWSYYDRNDNLTGARTMQVEVVLGDTSGHLAWCYTDLSGNYSCGPFTNPGAVGVRTIMWTYTSYALYGNKLTVVNPDWCTTCTYGVTQPNATVFPDGTYNIGSWYLNNGLDFERAFWIQRDIIDAYRFIWFGTGMYQSPQETTGSTTVQWKIDSTDGTYYMHGDNIHLKGADPLSNTVVNHEYAHNIMYTVYGNWFPTTYCPIPHNC